MSLSSSYNSSSSLNILQWNVKSLPARINSLQNLLAHYKCSIAILSETWLLPSRVFNIPQFIFLDAIAPTAMEVLLSRFTGL